MAIWFTPLIRCLRRLWFGLLVCLATFHMPVAQAADSEGNFAVDGIGNLSCAHFADAAGRKSPEIIAAIGWLDGYLSAFNQLQPETYDLTL